MSNPNAEEFQQIIDHLAEDHGLQRLRDKLVRFNALVTRRRATSTRALADQLYMLTGGLRREVPATVAIHSLWAEQVNEKLGEDGAKELEKVADQVNSCLGERDRLIAGKEDEIDGFLRAYEQRLARAIGAQRARIDMILKAVPDVAARLRAMPLVTVEEAAAETAPAAGDEDEAAESGEPSA